MAFPLENPVAHRFGLPVKRDDRHVEDTIESHILRKASTTVGLQLKYDGMFVFAYLAKASVQLVETEDSGLAYRVHKNCGHEISPVREVIEISTSDLQDPFTFFLLDSHWTIMHKGTPKLVTHINVSKDPWDLNEFQNLRNATRLRIGAYEAAASETCTVAVEAKQPSDDESALFMFLCTKGSGELQHANNNMAVYEPAGPASPARFTGYFAHSNVLQQIRQQTNHMKTLKTLYNVLNKEGCGAWCQMELVKFAKRTSLSTGSAEPRIVENRFTGAHTIMFGQKDQRAAALNAQKRYTWLDKTSNSVLVVLGASAKALEEFTLDITVTQLTLEPEKPYPDLEDLEKFSLCFAVPHETRSISEIGELLAKYGRWEETTWNGTYAALYSSQAETKAMYKFPKIREDEKDYSDYGAEGLIGTLSECSDAYQSQFLNRFLINEDPAKYKIKMIETRWLIFERTEMINGKRWYLCRREDKGIRGAYSGTEPNLDYEGWYAHRTAKCARLARGDVVLCSGTLRCILLVAQLADDFNPEQARQSVKYQALASVDRRVAENWLIEEEANSKLSTDALSKQWPARQGGHLEYESETGSAALQLSRKP